MNFFRQTEDGAIETTEEVTAETRENRKRYKIRPWDIRVPRSIEEANAAIELVTGVLENIESQDVKDGEIGRKRMEDARDGWARKLAELEYAREVIKSGESTDPAVAKLQRENEDLKRQVADLSGKERARVRSLEEQIAGLLKTRDGHVAEIQRMQQLRPPVEKSAHVRSLHDHCAWTVIALEELIAQGVTLTPLTMLLLEDTQRSLPNGHLLQWKSRDGLFKREAAEAKYGGECAKTEE